MDQDLAPSRTYGPSNRAGPGGVRVSRSQVSSSTRSHASVSVRCVATRSARSRGGASAGACLDVAGALLVAARVLVEHLTADRALDGLPHRLRRSAAMSREHVAAGPPGQEGGLPRLRVGELADRVEQHRERRVDGGEVGCGGLDRGWASAFRRRASDSCPISSTRAVSTVRRGNLHTPTRGGDGF